MITHFVAGFVFLYNNVTPVVYLHPNRFKTEQECRAGGQPLWDELMKVAVKGKDSVLGDCLEVPDGIPDEAVKKVFLEKFPPNATTDAKLGDKH